MSIINGYSVYQSSIYNNAVQSQTGTGKTQKSTSTQKSEKTEESKKTNSGSNVQLSDKAKALLQELKKQYTNMDFFVTDSDSEEEAASGNNYSTKDYSVYIDAEELERMAEDEDVKNQNLALLDEAVGKLDDLKEQLADSENGDQVVNLGVTIGKDGTVSYFAELEKVSERQKEFVEKIRAEKKEAAEEAEEEKSEKAKEPDKDISALLSQDQYGLEKEKRTTVFGSSVEELLEKIAGVDWDSIKEETATNEPGSHFDLSI